MATVEIDGIPHYYEWILGEKRDRKPVMVFVHGWGGSSRYWESTARALSDTYDCLIYDMRGFGRSSFKSQQRDADNPHPDPRHPSYSMETYVEQLKSLLDALQLDRVSLHAHSMGASIAALFASRYGDRLHQLVLTCSGIFAYNKLTFTLFHRIGGLVVSFRPAWLPAIPGSDRLFMARFVHKPLPQHDSQAFLNDYLQADGSANLGTMYTCVSKHASIVMPQAFSALSVPTLLVAGEKDIIIPPRLGQQAAQLNDAIQYVEIPKVAHFPMLERPEAYLETLQNFLQPLAIAR
ncbi:MAG: alpha/beta hydrolase [Cyanobacteria bacterium J06648_11]